MSNSTRMAAAALITVVVSQELIHARQYVQDRQTNELLVEEFERAGLSRQLELGKKLVRLRDAQPGSACSHGTAVAFCAGMHLREKDIELG